MNLKPKTRKLATLATYGTGYALLGLIAVICMIKANYLEGVMAIGALWAISHGTKEIMTAQAQAIVDQLTKGANQ